LAITNAFICYKLFVFRTRGNILREYFRCYIVYGGMALAGTAGLLVLVESLGMSPVAANCVSTVVLTFVSYLSHRNFSFKSQ
jgi:putative flippase GtrA